MVVKKIPKYLHKQELDSLLENVRHTQDAYLMHQVLRQTSCRISEVRHLRVTDINFRAKTINVIKLINKEKAQRSVAARGSLLRHLKIYIDGRNIEKDAQVFEKDRLIR